VRASYARAPRRTTRRRRNFPVPSETGRLVASTHARPSSPSPASTLRWARRATLAPTMPDWRTAPVLPRQRGRRIASRTAASVATATRSASEQAEPQDSTHPVEIKPGRGLARRRRFATPTWSPDCQPDQRSMRRHAVRRREGWRERRNSNLAIHRHGPVRTNRAAQGSYDPRGFNQETTAPVLIAWHRHATPGQPATRPSPTGCPEYDR
jgi:hypothetical protein